MQNTPYIMVLLGHFNAKCTNWYKHDETNFEGIAMAIFHLGILE